MMYSLGEIEVHAKKAVRGAGFEWGFAEEAGKAVRWLEQQHLPGMKVLADYLSAYDHDSSHFVAPDVDFSLVSQADTEALLSEPASFIHSSHSGEQLLCPLKAGALLLDMGELVKQNSVTLSVVAYPLLLVPYWARLFTSTSSSVIGEKGTVSWSEGSVSLCVDHIRVQDYGGLGLSNSDSVCLSPINPIDTLNVGKCVVGECDGRLVDSAIWNCLNQLAYRIYVPATEESRQRAGPA